MATYTKCTAGIEPLLEAINSGSDAWKIALTNAAPTAKTSFVAGTDDLATGNGYTAGGNVATTTTAAQSAGTYSLTLANPATWTASGAGIGPRSQASRIWGDHLGLQPHGLGASRLDVAGLECGRRPK